MKRSLLAAALGIGLLVPHAAFAQNPFRGNKGDEKPKTTETQKKDKEKDQAKEDSADVARVAHFKIKGDLSEAPVPEESLFGPPGENLHLLQGRILKAARDQRVKAIYLEIGEITAGFGKLNELRATLAEARKAGKTLFAYSEEFSAKAYLLALCCDHILQPESGGIMLAGMRAEVTFYKNTLDLLRLKVDVAKVGNYKSAVEPFLRDTMSAENREQIQSMLDDNFMNEMIRPIVAGRPKQNWSEKAVEALIDQGPFTARKARELGLIDDLVYEDQLESHMAKVLDAKSVKVDRNFAKPKPAKLDFSNPFAMLDILGGAKEKKESKEPKIAVIYVIGAIQSGKSGGGNPLMGDSVGSETIVEAIQKADKDDTVKAIVLRIDSPGGSALASDMMWRALSICKKPVIASMGDVAASGGYYVAMPCKKIFAEPGTITGSIGVFGMKIVTNGLEEWAGMKTEVVSRGRNSGVMSSTFPWSESEKKVVEETVEEVYDQFTSKALAGRIAAGKKMTMEELKALAGGRVWTGRQAKKNGLVDELGTLDDAIAEAKRMAGIDPKEKLEILPLPKATNFLEQLLEGEANLPFASSSMDYLKVIPNGDKAIKALTPLLATQKDTIKVLLPYMVEFK